MNKSAKLLPTLLLAAGLVAGSTSLAASAWVSVPSTPDASGKVVITGGNLPSWSAVTVLISLPDGTTTEYAKTIASDGTLSVEYLAGIPGGYSVKIIDQDGKEIGRGHFDYGR